MTEPDKHGPETLDTTDLDALAAQLRAVVDVRDRQFGLPARHYPRCFVGSEAVAAMIGGGMAADTADAVRLGNLLLEAGVFRHVLGEHPFRDEYLFYRFARDGGHGEPLRADDGRPVSWADFLAPSWADEAGANLQADIPARDPDLASLSADDLHLASLAPLDEHNIRLLDEVRPRGWRDPTPAPRYNLVVLGGGAGGLVSAAAAAGLGARVALVESHLLGGDCLNVGCVPSKALIRCAKAAHAMRTAEAFGVRCREVEVDFAAIMARVRRLRAGIAPTDSARRYAEELGVDVFLGRGVFTGPDTLDVDGRTLSFAKAIVATGATAAIPAIPGLARVPYLTNATVFNLTARPASMAVIGAGPIGIELAQAFQRLGTAVTVYSRGEILPREDPDAVRAVRQSLERDGVRLVRVSEYLQVDAAPGAGPVTLAYRSGDEERKDRFEALLIAAGRKPTVAGMGLEDAGVAYDGRDGIQVNDRLQTTNPDIFAVGDVASRYQFTHMSDFMARLAVRNALFFGRERQTRLLVPWATYTDPEVAHVGLYEADLVERGVGYRSFVRPFDDVDRAVLDGDTEGFVKIHVESKSDRILGATIVGSHAGDMISEVSVAIQAGMGLSALAQVIHPYPTRAEAIRQCGDAYNRSRLTPTLRTVFNRLMSLQR